MRSRSQRVGLNSETRNRLPEAVRLARSILKSTKDDEGVSNLTTISSPSSFRSGFAINVRPPCGPKADASRSPLKKPRGTSLGADERNSELSTVHSVV